MRAICLYLHLHQPWRFERYSIFDVAHDHCYWDEIDYYDKQNNQRIFEKVAKKSYRPMLNILEKSLNNYAGFKVSLSITGTWLDQAELWAPELIQQIKRMVETGRCEIVAETYYHSMSFFYNREEFEEQVRQHERKIQEKFGVKPAAFRNTELAYNDELGKWCDEHGYKVVLAEGWDRVLDWRSPNHVYRPLGASKTRLLLKNYRLSDDIAFRFSNRGWSEWPLTVDKYQNWLNMDCLRGNLINLFMDFETFGEHQWEDTGIFKFFEDLVYKWLAVYDNQFLTVSEAADSEEPADEISMPTTVTWADTERDLSAWMSNDMQREAMEGLYEMRERILATKDAKLIEDFRRLTTSDHAYYMCTKYWNDGDVHAYFSAYDSPFDAFMYFMNILRDLEYR
ncbi:MAG: glycoside hydrolase family 57 protein, partial [Candidatus Saccharibacteria bacterium]|nr:glycoside hydrolase family 57 protein [Candidatus Saccharibacteria bacterium]